MTEALIRTPRDKRAYRLRCRFAMPAYSREEWVHAEKVRMAERFIADMAKQGWEYVERFGFKLTGPYPATPTMTLPKRSQIEWNIPSRELLGAVEAGYRPGRAQDGADYVMNVPLLEETDTWEFELAGVFTRPELLTEYADPHEEEEARKKR